MSASSLVGFRGPLAKSRGFALGLSAAGIPLAAAITGPASLILIEHFGWKAGYYGLAMIPLLVGLPVAAFGIRMAPSERQPSMPGRGAGCAGLGFRSRRPCEHGRFGQS